MRNSYGRIVCKYGPYSEETALEICGTKTKGKLRIKKHIIRKSRENFLKVYDFSRENAI